MLPAKLDGCIQTWVVFPGVVVGEREVARDRHNLGYTVRVLLLRRIVPSCMNMSMVSLQSWKQMYLSCKSKSLPGTSKCVDEHSRRCRRITHLLL